MGDCLMPKATSQQQRLMRVQTRGLRVYRLHKHHIGLFFHQLLFDLLQPGNESLAINRNRDTLASKAKHSTNILVRGNSHLDSINIYISIVFVFFFSLLLLVSDPARSVSCRPAAGNRWKTSLYLRMPHQLIILANRLYVDLSISFVDHFTVLIKLDMFFMLLFSYTYFFE